MSPRSSQGNGPSSVRKRNPRARTSFWAQGRRLPLAFALAFILICFALAFVWTNYTAVQMGYVGSQLNQEQARLIDLNRKLKLELANLTSLDRLEKLARENLGLVSPRPEQVQVVE